MAYEIFTAGSEPEHPAEKRDRYLNANHLACCPRCGGDVPEDDIDPEFDICPRCIAYLVEAEYQDELKARKLLTPNS